MKLKVDCLDLTKKDIKRLQEYISIMQEPGNCGGLAIPIRSVRKGKGKDAYWNEWELADDWKGKRK